jgi:hypothetical protein
MGSGVIKAQISSRTPCTAARSAAEADEAIAANQVKIKETLRNNFPCIFLPSVFCTSRKNTANPSVFWFGRSLLICVNDGSENRLRQLGPKRRLVRPSITYVNNVMVDR